MTKKKAKPGDVPEGEDAPEPKGEIDDAALPVPPTPPEDPEDA